jgi:hypothetical protein
MRRPALAGSQSLNKHERKEWGRDGSPGRSLHLSGGRHPARIAVRLQLEHLRRAGVLTYRRERSNFGQFRTGPEQKDD